MGESPIRLMVFFDFLCPFCDRANTWLNQVSEQLGERLILEWRFFALEQLNAPVNSDWKIWEQSDDYTTHVMGGRTEFRGLLALWGTVAAQQQGDAASGRFRNALFRARHDEQLDMSQRDAIQQIAEQVGLDMARFTHDFRDRSLLEVLRRDYEEGRALYRVSAVPTLCHESGTGMLLGLRALPPADEAVPFFEEWYITLVGRLWLNEIKRTPPPVND